MQLVVRSWSGQSRQSCEVKGTSDVRRRGRTATAPGSPHGGHAGISGRAGNPVVARHHIEEPHHRADAGAVAGGLAVQTLSSSQAWSAGSNARRRAAITGHRVCRHPTARPDRGPRRPAADCAAARRAGQADRPAIASRSSRPSRSGANLAHGPGERHTCRRAIATTLRGCINEGLPSAAIRFAADRAARRRAP